MASIFTQIIKREIPATIIYEDQNHIAFFDIQPFEHWHTLVVPKKEYPTIMDMPEDEYLALQKVVYRISKHYAKVLDCGINILQNNKSVAEQSVFHVHFHIIPRREDWMTLFSWKSTTYLNNEAAELQSILKI